MPHSTVDSKPPLIFDAVRVSGASGVRVHYVLPPRPVEPDRAAAYDAELLALRQLNEDVPCTALYETTDERGWKQLPPLERTGA